MSGTQSYTTVLPHEPLPVPRNGDGDGGNSGKRMLLRGHIHLQGAFVPKRREKDDGGNCSKLHKKSMQQQSTTRQCPCCDAGYIQRTLYTNLQSMLDKLWGMSSDDLIDVHVIQETNDGETNANASASTSVSKVRLTLSSPAVARTLTSRLRRGEYSPRDLLASTITPDDTSAKSDSNGDVNNGNPTLHTLTVSNEGLCPHGCSARYAGRALQVTQVTPVPVITTTDANNASSSSSMEYSDIDNMEHATRWARAAPPKFRRLQLTAANNTQGGGGRCKLTEDELDHRRSRTRFVYVENVLGDDLTLDDVAFNTADEEDGAQVEVWKGELLSIFRGGRVGRRSNLSSDDTSSPAEQLYSGMVEDDVRHAFQEGVREALCRDGMCPYYPDASQQQRQQQCRVDSKGDDACSSNNNTTNCLGVELFMKVDTTTGKKGKKPKKSTNQQQQQQANTPKTPMLYDHLHIGTRSNGDATKLIQTWQGKRITLSMELPKSFVHHVQRRASLSGEQSTTFEASETAPSVNITTGKLFLDYADVMLPKNRSKTGVLRQANNNSNNDTPDRIRGEPSRPECTSSTSHVNIPGLHVVPDFVTEHEERVLLAILTGPHAPWAPPQYTPSGGQIKRRVQHYGYVFDYESADVLRRRDVADASVGGGKDDEKRSERWACPPLPSIHPSREEVLQMTNSEVEEWIGRSVEDVRGWEALAGVIERTRRYDFATAASSQVAPPSVGDEDKQGAYREQGMTREMTNLALNGNGCSLDGVNSSNQRPKSPLGSAVVQSNEHTQKYPRINQLTINEYTPGQGIGSHVDTETAFDDGLLIITLNGGIVMEFRNVDPDNETRKLQYLPPRSLVLLSRDARYKWEHMIVSRTTDTVDGKVLPRKLRVSLTLRTALAVPMPGERAVPLPLYETSIFPPRWGQPSDSELESKLKKCNVTNNGTTIQPINERSDLVTPTTESRHVHAVYDAIATQWHHTRGRRGVLWPGATRFLEGLPMGSVVADVGCGDGKYFSAITAASSYVIGTDISEPLLRTAAAVVPDEDDVTGKRPTSVGPQYQRMARGKRALSARPAVAVADCIHLPLRSGGCDAAICIAVMHHLSTEGRRLRCLSELRRIVRAGGLINVQAWALEQDDDSRRKFHGTDVLVPFNAQPKYLQTIESKDHGEETPDNSRGKGVAQMMAEQYNGAEFDSKKNLVVFQRYCHMYRKGELESLCNRVPGLEVLDSSYEKGNHVVLLRAV